MFLKSKIPKLQRALHVLQSVPLLLVALILTFSLNTLQTHATNLPSASEVAGTIADIVGVNGGTGGNKTVVGGINPSRTGYLAYLLDENGSVVGPTLAFKSPGYYQLDGTAFIATSRKGVSVSIWEQDPAPWGVPPFNKNKGTNYAQIKAWMMANETGTVNSVKFVADYWDKDLALKFKQGELILTLETLLHFQFSYPGTQTGPKKASSIDIVGYLKQLYGLSDTWQPSAAYISEIAHELDAIFQAEYEANGGSSSGFIPVNPPIIGTVVDCADFYNLVVAPNQHWFKAYTHNTACFTMMIEKGGIGEKYGKFTAWTGSTAPDYRMSDGDIEKFAVGTACFKAIDEMQTTCDETITPYTPHEPPEESEGTYTIVKTYRLKKPDGTYEDKTPNPSYRENVAPQILIENEKEYQVVGWKITNSTSKSPGYNPWNPPGTQQSSGTTPTTVRIEPEYKTLYVLLEKIEPPEPEIEDYNYKISQSSITRRVWFSKPDNQLTMPKILDHTFQWTAAAHKTTCPGTHPFEDDCNGDHVGSHSDSCPKKCPDTCESDHEHITADCSDPHYYNCGSRCQTQYASCSGFDWKERQLKLSINNTLQNEYQSILVPNKKHKWNAESEEGGIVKQYYNDGAFDRESPEVQTYEESNWDYVCVLMRGADKLTLAEWENAGQGSGMLNKAKEDLADISDEGFKSSNQRAGIRKIQDYMETFNATFGLETSDGVDNETTYGPTIHASIPGYASKGSTICADDPKGVTLTAPLEINGIKVKVEVYSGEIEGGVNDTSCNEAPVLYYQNPWHTSYHTSGRMVRTKQTISFRPYIKMKYDTLTEQNLPAFVLSEHIRQMTPNAYAEISWKPYTDYNLELFSPQWSTHAEATTAHGTNSVLPGGATLSLQIPKSNRQEVILTTYYPIVEGYGEQQIDLAGGSYGDLTADFAAQYHSEFVSSVVSSLEATVIQQYVDKEDTKRDAFGGIPVTPGCNISALGNTKDNKASTEDKYYFRNDGSNSALIEGDLDVDQGETNEIRYTFFSNTQGEIRCVTGDNPGDNPAEHGENDGAIVTDGDIDGIDARTYVRRKLQAAVERQTGEDDEALTGTQWYNEAFDGVTILVQETKLTVGFIDPPERTQVLDPKLTPKTEAQKDIFSDYFISQFRTRDHSEIYGKDRPYIMGRYIGEEVQMKNLENFYKSRPFYIPNATTQDLH